ncbi:uncharacterized protein RHOBADRAFT_55853 [Rhodotorula graminis WP1]|uniref:Nuclear pore complex NUP2/50/61 domain-containing protein n=1 Tax=Rhodotorula graminis (strain WP1) TaxID=578459 RepID=A0A0N8PZI0_RHOGW|nr:uncharacterized protein RHOBADRAFT_55853 [Rhodotorula graminis WP1]KPV72381.1 hypothetical protein RHOBADRAFT_55853 [Rhodotorula graminis WP1]
MAKRGAEKQITQDNTGDDDDRSDEGGEGEFRKASDAQLAGRKIRGLPKRKGAAGGQRQAQAPRPQRGHRQRPNQLLPLPLAQLDQGEDLHHVHGPRQSRQARRVPHPVQDPRDARRV